MDLLQFFKSNSKMKLYIILTLVALSLSYTGGNVVDFQGFLDQQLVENQPSDRCVAGSGSDCTGVIYLY